jgi:hypothetical protein
VAIFVPVVAYRAVAIFVGFDPYKALHTEKQAMYAWNGETGCGFFDGVCAPDDRECDSLDPLNAIRLTHSLKIREVALATASHSKDERDS